MGTYRELQDRINLDYLNRTDLAAATKRAIKNAIATYEAHRFFFNETATTTTTTASSASLGVPSDFIALDRLEIAYSGTNLALCFTPFAVIREMNAVSATAVPTHFAYRGNRFELALIPDSAYSTTCYYLHSLPELSADADTNAWTTEASNLIAHAATVDMLTSVLHVEDEARIARHHALMMQAWNELHMRNAVRVPSKLRATRF